MKRWVVSIIVLLVAVAGHSTVVADSLYRSPLPNASVFDRRGHPVGVCGADGRLPYVSPPDYPITIRYIGYDEKTVPYAAYDTVFLRENVTQLPDLVVSSKEKRALHILAYVREFSTVSTFTDTITMFREKTVDFMLPLDGKSKFTGWSNPRVLSSKSYYRFSNQWGHDSVSNRCNNHFSWADWVGIAPAIVLPPALHGTDNASDTIMGKYSHTEIWKRTSDRLDLNVDVLADTSSRKWVPNLSNFFRNNLDFERFQIRYNFSNPSDDRINPALLSSYSFNIESNGRGVEMFRFNRRDQIYSVTTYGEVYIIDRQTLSVKEAKRLERMDVADLNVGILVPEDAPSLPTDVMALVERVDTLDHDAARLGIVVDKRVAAFRDIKFDVGKEILSSLKGIVGIDKLRGRYLVNRQWKQFRRDRVMYNVVNNSVDASD